MSIWKSGYDRLLNYIFYLPLGGEQSFRRKCLDFACIEKGDKVLDVGCGSGTLTRLIGECLGHSGQVIGVDLSESTLKEARNLQHQRIAFTCACGENLPLRSSRFMPEGRVLLKKFLLILIPTLVLTFLVSSSM